MILYCLAVALLFVIHRTSAVPSPRLSIVDWTNYFYHEPSGPGTYAFGYDIDDTATDNVQFRNEERHPNGTVTGSYGYVDPDGNVRIVHYIADHKGYRATEESDLRLSMLKPIRYLEKPFFLPGGGDRMANVDEFEILQEHPGDRFYYQRV